MGKRVFLLLSFLLLVSGCSTEPLTDPYTKPELGLHTVDPDMITFKSMNDAMDRGKHEFFNREVVVDPNHYSEVEFKRGDIVLYQIPQIDKDKYPHIQIYKDQGVLRVVGLAGEKIKIIRGQIFIDNKKLDTFYGSFHRMGMNLEEYLEWRKKTNQDKGKSEKQVRKDWLNGKGTNMSEILIPEGHVFLVGDDWFRSIDSKIFGPVSIENIIGKVVGFKR